MPKLAPIPTEPEPLLDVSDAARITGTTERMIRRLVDQRALPSVKIGRYVKIHPDALREYIARNTRSAR